MDKVLRPVDIETHQYWYSRPNNQLQNLNAAVTPVSSATCNSSRFSLLQVCPFPDRVSDRALGDQEQHLPPSHGDDWVDWTYTVKARCMFSPVEQGPIPYCHAVRNYMDRNIGYMYLLVERWSLNTGFKRLTQSSISLKLMLKLCLSDQSVASYTKWYQNLFEVWYKQAQEIIAWDNISTDNGVCRRAHQTKWCNKDFGSKHCIKTKKKKQPKHHCVGVHFPLHNQVGVGVFIKEMTDHNISLIGLNRNATTILQITPWWGKCN